MRRVQRRLIVTLICSIALVGCGTQTDLGHNAPVSVASGDHIRQPASAPAANVFNSATDGETPADSSNRTGDRGVPVYDLTTLIKRTEPSVVRIDTIKPNGGGIASGFVVGADGVVVTNYHVIKDATSARATFPNGASAKVAGVLLADSEKDIAIVRLLAAGSLPSLSLADKIPEKGASVVAFGAPEGLSFTATEGIVSAIRDGKEFEAVPDIGRAKSGTWIQTSAPISQGNSGGPLVDLYGQVIGANTWKHAYGENLNFAISSTNIAEAVTAARSAKLVTLPLDGISTTANSSTNATFSVRIGSAATDASRKFVADLEDELDQRRQEVLGMHDEMRKRKAQLKEAMLAGDATTEKHETNLIGFVSYKIAAKIHQPLPHIYKLNPSALETGQIGHLGGAVVEVFQILNKSNGAILGRVSDVQTSTSDKLIRFNNLLLHSVVDDDVLKIANNLVFEVNGTRTYTTVSGGTNTIFEVTSILDIKDMLASFEKSIPVEAKLPTLTKDEEDRIKSLNAQLENEKRAKSRTNAANSKLTLAKMLLAKGKTSEGERWLKQIVSQFPGTDAATEAAALLEKP